MSALDLCTFLRTGDSVRGANRDIGVALSSRFAPRTENNGNRAAEFQRWIRGIAKALLIVFVCSIAWLFNADSANSQIIDWTNSSGAPDPWLHDPGNWNGGVLPGSPDTARFQLAGATNVWWNATTSAAIPDVGKVQVLDGQLKFLNQDTSPQQNFQVRGTIGGGQTSDFQITGPTASLIVQGMHVANYGGAEITNSGGLTVDGWHSAGSQFSVNDAAGFNVDGNVYVQFGGVVSSTSSRLASKVGSSATVYVINDGSQWNNSNTFSVGENGAANLIVGNRGTVSNNTTYIGQNAGSLGDVTVTGFGSQLNSTANLAIGWMGDAQGNLLVDAGGVVTNTDGYLGGLGSAAVGTATITGSGSIWNNNNNLYLGTPDGLTDGGAGTLNIEDRAFVYVGDDRSTNISSLAHLVVSDSGTAGLLRIRNGSVISTEYSIIGDRSGYSGIVTISGEDSEFNSTGTTWIGRFGDGTLQIDSGGIATSANARIGTTLGSNGTVLVDGTNSQWNLSQDVTIGYSGLGSLTVDSGAVTNNRDGIMGANISTLSMSIGTVSITGTDSQWNNGRDLFIGLDGRGLLAIDDGGLVTVARNTSINSLSSVSLGGGRFEFGTTDTDSYSRIYGTGGELAGVVSLTGYNDINTIDLSIANLDTTGVQIGNSGVIHGGGYSTRALVNQATGEVRTQSNEWIRFGGSGNTNAGEINNLGGTVEFEDDLTNQITGFISGRGLLIANGGWTNNGVMAFSGGFTDIHGDLANSSTGQIAIGGGSVTTFNDDVTMDAANMNMDIAENSVAVFFGSYNGGSTGLGSVHAFGDLRPGNSPAVVSFGGDLELAASTLTFIELGGTNLGEFDQLDVDGSLTLNGELEVSMIDGFTLGWNQQFVIADVDGTLSGQFANFGEGDLVGNYGGHDLYISYSAGDGNDVGLFTAVPEPSSFVLLNAGWLALLLTKRRRRQKPTQLTRQASKANDIPPNLKIVDVN